MNRILVTGTAGFIGFHLANRLIRDGWSVIGVDNINDYYDVKLKHDRLAILEKAGMRFHKLDIADRPAILDLFANSNIKRVVHLAAQAGVRYSISHPDTYVQSNMVGFQNILDASMHSCIYCISFLDISG